MAKYETGRMGTSKETVQRKNLQPRLSRWFASWLIAIVVSALYVTVRNLPTVVPLETTRLTGTSHYNHKPPAPTPPFEAHVVYAADKNQLIGLQSSIQSLIRNTKTPGAVVVHIFRLVPEPRQEEEEEEQQQQQEQEQTTIAIDSLTDQDLLPIRQCLEVNGGTLQTHDYQMSEVAPFLNTHFNKRLVKVRTNLLTPANYVRFLLPARLDQTIEFSLWIDSDIIVQGDIVSYLQGRNATLAVAAFPRWRQTDLILSFRILRQLEQAATEEQDKNVVLDLAPPRLPTFNAGFVVFNLNYWRDHDLIKQVLTICNANRRLKLWTNLGSQPPLQLLFGADRFEILPPHKYVGHLGVLDNVNDLEHDPKQADILHWNGRKKPWLENGLHKQFWVNYSLPCRHG